MTPRHWNESRGAALASALPFPGEVARIFPLEMNQVLKKQNKTKSRFIHVEQLHRDNCCPDICLTVPELRTKKLLNNSMRAIIRKEEDPKGTIGPFGFCTVLSRCIMDTGIPSSSQTTEAVYTYLRADQLIQVSIQLA